MATRAELIKQLKEQLKKSHELLDELHKQMYSEERHQNDFKMKEILWQMTGEIDNYVYSEWTPGFISVTDYKAITGKEFVGTTRDGITYPQTTTQTSTDSSTN